MNNITVWICYRGGISDLPHEAAWFSITEANTTYLRNVAVANRSRFPAAAVTNVIQYLCMTAIMLNMLVEYRKELRKMCCPQYIGK